MKSDILFVCTENSSRSQMAEGFAKARGMIASSGGTMPATSVNPLVVEVMKEKGIDISGAKPKKITDEVVEQSQIVVLTDSSLESLLPKNIRKKIAKKLVFWSISDTQGQSIEAVRFIKDSIERSLNSLLQSKSD